MARPTPPRSTRPRRGSTGRRPAEEIERQVRAFNPVPGRLVRGQWRADQAARSRSQRIPAFAGMPGEVLDDALLVACGEDAIRPLLVQRAGRGPMSTRGAAARLRHPQGHDPAVTRWRLTIEYDGGPFMGWQRQDHGPSVQQTLEEALQRMTGEQAAVHAAGRTDAGVHALAMTAHVDVVKSLTAHRLREGLNALVRPHPSRCWRSSRSRTTGTRASPASAGAIFIASSTAARRRRSTRGVCGTSPRRSTSRRCARARSISSDATTSPPSARPNASRTAR